MTDVEQRLRELGERVPPSAATPALPSPETVRRIRIRQRLLATGSFGLGAAVLVALLMWGPSLHLKVGNGAGGVGGVNTGPSVSPPGSNAPPGWVVHHTGSGISIATPRAWTFSAKNPTKMTYPNVDFALGTWRFPSGGSCAPTRALHNVPANGMFLYMFDYPAVGKRESSKRPLRFKLGPLKGPFECLGVRTHLIVFRQHHRYFHVHIKFGPQAGHSLRRTVIQSLDTLRIAPKRS